MELRNREISMTVRQSLIRLGYKQRLEALDPELVENAYDVDRALGFLDTKKEQSGKQKPVRFDDLVDKLISCRVENGQICFFSPWGPRYKIKTTEVTESSAETATLKEVREVFDGLADLGFKIRFLVMPADTYGTEINSLSQDFVDSYFSSLKNAVDKIMRQLIERGCLSVEIVPWSIIKGENAGEYFRIKSGISEMPLPDLMRDALRKARVMNPGDVDRSARKYVEERVTEAILIDQLYNPIKLSLVKKENDAADLQSFMRIYVIRNKAPWMASLGDLLRN